MDIGSLIELLDHPQQAADRLATWGLRDPAAGAATIVGLAAEGLPLDALAEFCGFVAHELTSVADRDDVWQALGSFVLASRSPLATVAMFERDRDALPLLLRLLDLGPQWRTTIVSDPEAFDLVRMSEGAPIDNAALRAEVWAEVANFTDERHIVRGLRRIVERERLRIAYGDIVKRQSLELVTEQLTNLAEAAIEAAVRSARRQLQERSAQRPTQSTPGQFAVIALGRLGGREPDYSAPLELLFLHERLPDDEHRRRAAAEHYERLAKLTIRLLTERTDDETPLLQIASGMQIGSDARLAHPADEAFCWLDGFGRTWHRAAFVQARCVAGDCELAQRWLQKLQPWIYRRYLSRADEMGIRAQKHRLERDVRASKDGEKQDGAVVARQIEAVVVFLQLLNGGDLPAVRAPNTLAAIAGLEQAGVLSDAERMSLEEGYRAARLAEHRRQTLAAAGEERLVPQSEQALVRAEQAIATVLSSAFANEPDLAPEVDLLLDPGPNVQQVERVLGKYGFKETQAALEHLHALSDEQAPFLSTRRCRYFLSAIVPQLLTAVAATPDPDFTLSRLQQVSESLGGKGVLWQLFGLNRPSLELYVKLCAASPYLSNILTSNPGMIDELVDSLQLARLPSLESLRTSAVKLSRGADPAQPLLHGLKISQHLQIGVRDLLGREDVQRVSEALSNVAEVCVVQVAQAEYEKLAAKHGRPSIGEGPQRGSPCGFAIVALGEFASRELHCHSPVELVFVYAADGMTGGPAASSSRGRREQPTTNGHFFSQLALRTAKELSQLTPQGRLYGVDLPLKPASGFAGWSLAELEQRFRSDAPPELWRLLLRARPIFGDNQVQAAVQNVVTQLLEDRPRSLAGGWQFAPAENDSDSAASDLLQGAGGLRDLHTLIDSLHWSRAGRLSTAANLIAAVAELHHSSVISAADGGELEKAASLLQQVINRLQWMSEEASYRLPTDAVALRTLALLQHTDAEALVEQCRTAMQTIRAIAERLLASETHALEAAPT